MYQPLLNLATAPNHARITFLFGDKALQPDLDQFRDPLILPESFTTSLIEEALAPVREDLGELDQRMPQMIPVETQSARAVIDHVFKAGGKRIRPALFFMGCRLLGYDGPHYYPIGAVPEFVHTASLLHDDVVDNSTLRRNKPTANSIYGDQTSVLVGDLIYSTASEIMASSGNMEIVKTFARAIRLMSDGELLQLENIYNPKVDEKTYFRILECKTAILIEASCKSAGLLAQASFDETDQLARFGYAVGIAFQLIDDALDYAGSAELIGKPILSDLGEGKITMPVIKLFQVADAKDQSELREILESQSFCQGRLEKESIERVAQLVEKYDTANATVEHAQEYTQMAMQSLSRFPAGKPRDVLENLAKTLLYRFS